MKTKCSNCGARYDYDESEAGTTVKCECGTMVEFPAVKAPEPPRAPPPQPPPPMTVPAYPRAAPKAFAGQSPAPEAPGYAAVEMAAGVMVVFGIVQMIASGVFALAAIIAADNKDPILPNATAAMIVIGGFITGILYVGFGQVFLCLRDMAINSFHIRRQTLNPPRP